MFLDNNVIDYGQPLAGAYAHLLGGKKWIKDFVFDRLRNPAAGISDPDLHPVVQVLGADRYVAASFQAAVGVDPKYFDAYVSLGVIYAARKDNK